MTDIPVWLLDVDGVINACTKKPDRSIWPAEDWLPVRAHANDMSWPILAAQPVLSFLRRVHELGAAEIRWHTTWQESTVGLAEVLDLPAWPVQDAPEYATWNHRGVVWWKFPAAERVVMEEGRDLVWTDDDCSWELDRGQGDELGRVTRVLIVSPNERTGLTRKHLRKIAEFLNIDQEATK